MEYTQSKTRLGIGYKIPWPIALSFDEDYIYLTLQYLPSELEGEDVYLCLEQSTCRRVYRQCNGDGNPCHTGGKFFLVQSGGTTWTEQLEERIISNPTVGDDYLFPRQMILNTGVGNLRYCPDDKPNPWALIRGTLRIANRNGTLMRTIYHSNTARIGI